MWSTFQIPGQVSVRSDLPYTENVVVLLDAKLISRTEIFLPTEDCGRSVCQKAIEQDRENQKIQWMWLYAPTRFTYSGEN